MTNTRKSATGRSAPAGSAQRGDRDSQAADRQPQATGAHRGSPAASVMKQFAKTRAESTGKSRS
jgi:hypothetical protein